MRMPNPPVLCANPSEDAYHQLIYSRVEDYHAIGAGNPFEFDSDDVQTNPDRNTTFTDFMSGTNTYEATIPHPSRKTNHLKNSQSEGNATYMTRRREPIHADEHEASRLLHRSDSSPSVSPTRIAVQGFLQSSNDETNHSCFRCINHGPHANDLTRSLKRGRGLSGSSSKQLEDVPQTDENAFETPSRTQNRSRSPVRKIFGEGGWLGSANSKKEESSTPKKPGLVEKIKLKIEEIVGLADRE